jgi:hypothetical protein
MASITLVSAFFDINRETRGDGRRLEEYMEWITRTLQLNCNLYIITEARFIDFMKSNRPSEYQERTYYKADTLENAMYYKYLPRMREIINSPEYKSRIMHPDRVECKLPEYNVIQYSKFGNASFSAFVFAFTIMYLGFPMFANGGPNFWVFFKLKLFIFSN